VRLVSRMSPTVDRQSAALYEGLIARFVVARIRTLVGVYAIMTLKIGFSIEALHHKTSVSLESCF